MQTGYLNFSVTLINDTPTASIESEPTGFVNDTELNQDETDDFGNPLLVHAIPLLTFVIPFTLLILPLLKQSLKLTITDWFRQQALVAKEWSKLV